jgi:ribosomal protein S27AE
MSKSERTTNATRAEGRNCTKCGQVFMTALDGRKECVKCRPVNAIELKQLMGAR